MNLYLKDLPSQGTSPCHSLVNFTHVLKQLLVDIFSKKITNQTVAREQKAACKMLVLLSPCRNIC